MRYILVVAYKGQLNATVWKCAGDVYNIKDIIIWGSRGIHGRLSAAMRVLSNY